MNTTLFYTNLAFHKEPVREILSKASLFQQIPNDWHIVITDIKGSTTSVENGFSELVNLIATGSIVAALNIASKHTIDIPFFFGGDGATMLIPPTLLPEIMEALILHSENIQKEYDIYLRVGSVSVAHVYENNQQLKIVKASINALYTIPVVLGNGLLFAEKIIKSNDKERETINVDNTYLDLDGMECRWNQISPPQDSHEIVALLVNAINESEQAAIFQKVLEKTTEIYGSLDKRNPISVPKLQLTFNYNKIKTELKASNKKLGIFNFLKVWITGVLGKYYYLPNAKGKKYLNAVIQLSDILVIDGRINMIISGNTKQRELLTEYLDGLEKNEEIVYGINVSEKSIMSCYVRNRDANHIHFVDGGSSGYTRAAKILKEKIRNKQLSI